MKVAGGAAVAMSASSYSRVMGANDRISIGIIGCGSRGIGAHMAGIRPHSKGQNVEITAVCDPWRVRQDMAAAKVKEWYNRDARKFSSYRDLLALKDVDAVMIASCAHQHTTHLKARYCCVALSVVFATRRDLCWMTMSSSPSQSKRQLIL